MSESRTSTVESERRLDEFAEFERRGWERVASRYVDTWHTLTRRFQPALLDAIRPREGDRLLDLACGPGDLAAAAAERGADVVATDFSSAMLEIAARRHPGLHLRSADAQTLPFPERSFDLVTMSFGLLHLPRPDRALAEIRRVLRPGGRFGFTLWAAAPDNPAEAIVRRATARFADPAIRQPERSAAERYSDPSTRRRALAEAGFDLRSLSVLDRCVLWRLASTDELFSAILEGGVCTGELLRRQDLSRRRAIRDAIGRDLEPFWDGERYTIPYTAQILVVSAPRARSRPDPTAARPSVAVP